MIQGIFILFLACLVFILYSGNLDGPFIFDDSRIQNNPAIHITHLTVQNLFKAGFESAPGTRPVAHISFALNHYFHGFSTRGYHVANFAIHGLAAVFLYLFIHTTLNLPPLRSRYGHQLLLPIGTALLWAVHPLQTQSVTYIIQRMNSMAALFYVLSLYLYARGRLATGTGKKWALFSGTTVAGVLALGSKETAATLPFFIFLYEWYFFQDLDSRWLKRQMLPALVLLLLVVFLALLYLGRHPAEYILATYSGRDFTPWQRILTEFRVVVFYLSLLVFPHPSRLNLDHQFALSTGLLSPASTLASASLLLFMLVTAAAGARRYRLVSFCLLWFLGNLAIESSFIGLEIIFEHRAYLPSMLLILLALILFFSIVKHSWMRVVFLCFVVLILSFWTFERNRVWSDRVTLWSDAAAKSPDKARPHNNLGVALKDRGKLDEAAAQFRQTIQLDPKFTEAYNNLGNTYILLGRPEEAIQLYRTALGIAPGNPLIHANLGKALLNRWQLEEALLHYREAVHLDPANRETLMDLASVQRMIEARNLRQRNMGKPGVRSEE